MSTCNELLESDAPSDLHVTIHVYQYSGVGSARKFKANLRTGAVVVEGEDGMNDFTQSSVGTWSSESGHIDTGTASEQCMDSWEDAGDDVDVNINMVEAEEIREGQDASECSGLSNTDQSSSDVEESSDEECISDLPAEPAVGAFTSVRIVSQSQFGRIHLSREIGQVRREHSNDSKGERVIVAAAVQHVVELVQSQCTGIQDGLADREEYRLVESLEEEKFLSLMPGWARRPNHGATYGKNYIDKYVDDIRELFQLGEDDDSRKMGAGAMQQALRSKYPNRYSIPGINAIRVEITKLMRRRLPQAENAMVATGSTPSSSTSKKRNRHALDSKYTDLIQRMLHEDSTLTARKALPAIKAVSLVNGELPKDFPGDKQLLNKWNNMKASRKNHQLAAAPDTTPNGVSTATGTGTGTSTSTSTNEDSCSREDSEGSPQNRD